MLFLDDEDLRRATCSLAPHFCPLLPQSAQYDPEHAGRRGANSGRAHRNDEEGHRRRPREPVGRRGEGQAGGYAFPGACACARGLIAGRRCLLR